ncbi:MAG: pilus assembly protein PilM, partial [Bdellovibrionales bacterium]|nr:pilus assembly protein PilM [Bdellovibrionales bacterium]
MISIGIDIGQFSIKIAELQEVSGQVQILKLDEFALSQDPNKDRKIEIVDILRTYIGKSQHENANFVLSLPEWQVTTRRKFFPFKERHKILKSLPFELEDDIPMDQEDAIFDAKVNAYTGNAAQVLALAAPFSRVSDKVQLSRDIGIDLSILSVDSLALANLVTRWDQAPPQMEVPDEMTQMDGDTHTEVTVVSPVRDKFKMILAIGHTNTIALFFSKGVLKSVRSLDWGGEELGQAVSKSYKMHYVEALKEVQRKGFLLNSPEGATKDQVRFSDVLKASLDDLTRKLKLMILETETEANAELESAFVTGGVSQLRNICPYLTQQMEVAFNPFHYIDQFGNASSENNAEIEPIFSQSLSLAVEGLRKPRNPAINLLKGQFAKEGQGFKPVWDKWGHTIRVG